MFNSGVSKRIWVKVIGIGGGGCNAVNGMVVQCNREAVDYIAVNTDVQALNRSVAKTSIPIGMELTKGLGTGGNPELGREAAQASRDRITQALKGRVGSDKEGVDLVFITSAMGGGTGSGASQVVAEIAKELGALTIGVVTRPFDFEGSKRRRIAENAIREMSGVVDAMIVTDNNRVLEVSKDNTSLPEAFLMADKVLLQGVMGVLDIITVPGEINMDFADVRTVMSSSGFATFGIGEGVGASRARTAAREAVNNSLQEVPTYGAKGLLVNIMASEDELGLTEVSDVLESLREHTQPDAVIKHGVVYSQAMKGKVRVYVVATGLSAESQGLSMGADAHGLRREVKPVLPQESVETASHVPLPTPVLAVAVDPPAPVAEKPAPIESERSEGRGSKAKDDLDLPAFLRRGSRARHSRPLTKGELPESDDEDDMGVVQGSLYP